MTLASNITQDKWKVLVHVFVPRFTLLFWMNRIVVWSRIMHIEYANEGS
ncbi:hypothetical protein [Lysinibacillus fusiformis]|nr:hypothetical protein [Lysinibacillus fusiformis]MDC6266689.1 hypothetical protein [Lysinibacillus sphaericus]MDN4969052.1 hypothetical protein [Lysinibacillus fusiformis]UXJ70959.1 hypothetical protein N5069_10605 [Lysinibacillus fusiformis]